ncbi:CU044_5270 family protein [Frankia sp. CNm7]|uniref:CU044_5270 family protein n=1 Tax=Frankia nepalensis TaxID=1836974 RepID=A0A937RJR2_9ACTN|nr:CU044_5270 family protein [Frankia nepalensis]MBL7501312.1 CU044_5270 family protein [Frankia nepalensis]MBL7510838.1 CU044_5270 family protein [Frankia nepalensis]MBL7521582.1 CU044_5270 family protein [Frankia nepalensis]MBL7628614.1 CU044_5270 family protein [Frankia nepalensis]
MDDSLPGTPADESAARAELAPLASLWTDVAEPAPAQLAQARRRLLDRVAAVDESPEPGATVTGATARRRGRRRRFVTARRAVAVAVAAVVAAAGLFAVDTLRVGGSAGATAEAATLLEQAAVNSAGTADPPVGPAQYRKITVRAVWSSTVNDEHGDEVTWLDEEIIETWIPADPARPWVLRRSGRQPVHWFDPADEAAVRGMGFMTPPQPTLIRAAGGAFYGPAAPGWQNPTPDFVASLPRDPGQLLDRIYRDSKGQGRSRHGEALVFIADLLRGGFVPVDLRAALFRAATGIPGVEVTDHAANLAGRAGVAIGRDEGGDTRQEIIFDPATGEYIGEREVVLRDGWMSGVPAGTAISYTAVTTEVVDSTPDGPEIRDPVPTKAPESGQPASPTG